MVKTTISDRSLTNHKLSRRVKIIAPVGEGISETIESFVTTLKMVPGTNDAVSMSVHSEQTDELVTVRVKLRGRKNTVLAVSGAITQSIDAWNVSHNPQLQEQVAQQHKSIAAWVNNGFQ